MDDRIEKQQLFERPDRDAIDIIQNDRGIILHAKKRDTSILAYLLRTYQADHGHESSANTYLDWQLAYLSTRGFKVANMGQHAGGDGCSDKVTLYLRLIRELGHQRQKLVEFAINSDNPVFAPYLEHIEHEGLKALPHLTPALDIMKTTALASLDILARAICNVRDKYDEEMQKVLDNPQESR